MRIILVLIYLIFYLIFTIPLMIAEWILGHFDQKAKDASSLAIVQWGFNCITFLSGTRVTVIGAENIPGDRAVMYAGNHRSFFDIVLTYTKVPAPTGFIAKKEVFKVPLLNVWMKNLHCISMDRKNIKEGLKSIMAAIAEIKSGISIFVFPEGTRNKTDEILLPFHDGSFKIADKGGCPIIPVTITNSRNIFENQFPWIKKTHVIIEYGIPIETSSLSKEEKKNISGMVSSVIRETYIKNLSSIQTSNS